MDARCSTSDRQCNSNANPKLPVAGAGKLAGIQWPAAAARCSGAPAPRQAPAPREMSSAPAPPAPGLACISELEAALAAQQEQIRCLTAAGDAAGAKPAAIAAAKATKMKLIAARCSQVSPACNAAAAAGCADAWCRCTQGCMPGREPPITGSAATATAATAPPLLRHHRP